MRTDSKLSVTTFLMPQDKALVEKRAKEMGRSVASQIEQLVIEGLSLGLGQYKRKGTKCGR